MNWMHRLFYDKKEQKHIDLLNKKIKELEHLIYGDRTWGIEQDNSGLKVTCPCLSEAEKIEENKTSDFIIELYACKRCNKKINIPRLKSRKSLY